MSRVGTTQRTESLEDRTLLSTVTVSTLQDIVDGDTRSLDELLASPGMDGKISLREAIDAANSSNSGGVELELLSSGDETTTIVFDPALTASGDATISLTSSHTAESEGEPTSSFGPSAFEIFASIEIVGPTGPNGIQIERVGTAPKFRLFHVWGDGALTLQNVTLSGGVARGGDGAVGGGGAAGLGGAIVNEGSLSIQNSTLINNQAIGGNGSDHVVSSDGGGGGGGLAGSGQAPSGNFGGDGGGPNGGAGGTQENSNGSAGDIGGGGGGGTADGSGLGQGGTGGFGGGGGAGRAGGGINGDNNRGGDGGFGGGGGAAGNSGSGSCADHADGGIGGFGGGQGGDAHGCSGDFAGGGGGAGLGGAIFNLGGSVVMVNSTISGNTAKGGNGAPGARVHNDQNDQQHPDENEGGIDGSGFGGGLFNLNGTVSLIHATFANNTAREGGGAIYNLAHEAANGIPASDNATTNLTNSVLADSIGPNDLVNEQRSGGVTAFFNFVGMNAIESAPVNNGNAFNGADPILGDPQLGALSDNNGPTQTHLPGLGSLLIDAGENSFAPETNPNGFGFLPIGDQRNFQRIVDGDEVGGAVVDIGAVEVGGVELPAVERDVFEFALLEVDVNVENVITTVILEGFTTHITVFDGPRMGDANDDDDNQRDDVFSVVTEGEFSGNTPFGFITVVLRVVGDLQDTEGGIEENSNSPGTTGTLDLPPFGVGTADSFFDVFFDVTIDGEGGNIHNDPDTALTLTAEVTAKPAGPGDRFEMDGAPISLLDEGNFEVAQIVDVRYTPLPFLDYGDAPEQGFGYATTAIRDGARHIVTSGGPKLGANVDVETDGQPNITANGDDTSGSPDDEDGVTLIGTLAINSNATFRVNAPNGGVLNAWIDLFGNGTFSEQFVTNEELAVGDNDFSIEIPNTPLIAAGNTYVRFRVNSTGNLQPTGLALDGEVEDYRVSIESFDFGDAPDTYGTTLDFDATTTQGAHHRRGGPTLGSFSDAELDGQPSESATDDDANGFDDEDGVDFSTTALVSGFASQVKVTASAVGFLNAWFDFNGDGNFGSYPAGGGAFIVDAGEQIFKDVAVVAGANTLTFSVPDGLEAGTTFARFRITSDSGVATTPHGLAPDGEVEDYGGNLVIEEVDLPDTEDDPNPNDLTFVFTVLQQVRRWYDPAIAVGYDYVTSGPNFKSVTLPVVGDNRYTLHLDDGDGGYLDTPAATLDAGVQYDFTEGFTDALGESFAATGGGLNRFRILGIETAAAVDPANPLGFVTGLSFTDMGDFDDSFTMTGIPETVYVDNASADLSINASNMSGDFLVTNDLGTIGMLDLDDVVTWFGSAGLADDVTGLIFGRTAFAKIGRSIDLINDNDYSGITSIQIAPGVFSEKLVINNDIVVTLIGAGSDQTFIDGAERDRVLRVDNGNAIVSLTGVTIQNGLEENGSGGGIENNGTMTITDSVIRNNRTKNGNGAGGIQNNGTMTITNSTIHNNLSSDQGGGIRNNNTLTIIDSTIRDNETSSGSGGGIQNRDQLTIINSTVSSNTANNGHGGGINNDGGTATITNSTISGNQILDGDGGGIVNQYGTLTLTNSTISGNTASSDGGGLHNYGGSATVRNSTISGNTASGSGGGVVNYAYYDNSTLTIIQSTISGNVSSGDGGGIFNYADDDTATLILVQSTVTGNRANRDGVNGGSGGGIWTNDIETLSNSIVAGNFRGQEFSDDEAPDDIDGNIDSANFNLIGDPDSSGNITHDAGDNIVGQDDGEGGRELLDITTVLDTTLRNNGGSTLTHRLVAGSPAINNGSNDLIPTDSLDLDGDEDSDEAVPFDQRLTGNPRVIGETVDIGAVELRLLDFGDAPDPLDEIAGRYPTLLENDGARHARDNGGPILGESVDVEADGQPSVAADGDDDNGDDDEDGVSFDEAMRVSVVSDRTGGVTVTVSDADAEDGAKLDAWIDFNQDGDWNDDGEQIFDDEVVENGEFLLTFTIPTGALPGQTFARFRISTAGVALPTGLADDGEVEDHVVTFLPGLVEVTVDEFGNLSIVDAGGQSNDITVTLDTRPNPDVFVVSSTTANLTVNGGLTATNAVRIAKPLVTGGLVANLTGGDDHLKFDRLSLNSTVMGGDGKDTVLAGSGRDQLFGESGNDSLVGNSGNDRLDGGSGNDTVSGLNGNDTLTGGTGTDRVLGGAGIDLWDEFSNAANVIVTAKYILGLGATPLAVEGLLSDVNLLRLTGGAGNNYFDASAAGRPATMLGGAGNDTLVGGSQRDVLSGEGDNDVLNGNAGNDTILGGDGDDLILGGAGNDVMDGGAGNDVVYGENGNDAIRGGAGNDLLYGNDGLDTLLGSEGNDALFGGAGRDLLLGEADADTVNGGLEKDRVARSGNSNPTVPGESAIDPIIEINELLSFNFNALLAGLDI